MLHTSHDILIRRNIEDVYRYVALEFFTNYPRWSPEVLELEQLTPGNMRVGVNGRQLRCDHGYRLEARFRVTSLVPLRELHFASLSKPAFEIAYHFERDGEFTRLTFDFRMQPTLMMRPFHERIRRAIKADSARMVANIRTLLEAGGEPPVAGARPGLDAG